MSILPAAHIGPGAGAQGLGDKAEYTDAEKNRRRRARAGIAAVDALLDILEPFLPQNPQVGLGMFPEWQRGVEASGLVVPTAVSSATTATLLHERLLDWQEELVNAAYRRRATHARLGTRIGTHGSHRARRQAALRPRRCTPGHLAPDHRAVAPLPPAEGSPAHVNLDGLTDREIGVLRVVAEGLTNAQVARRMHLSQHTVAAHLRSIFSKIRVRSRSAATRYAHEHGLT
jgi:DNA-binding CsgD family transcriptional regulator